MRYRLGRLLQFLGLIFPVVVGTVGFILIMVGRTGWDLLVYMGSFVTAVGIAVWMRWATVNPLPAGIEISRRTRSGRFLTATFTAARPSSARSAS